MTQLSDQFKICNYIHLVERVRVNMYVTRIAIAVNLLE